MDRYKKMTNEEIMAALAQCVTSSCGKCPFHKNKISNYAISCFMDHLREEIRIIPRWQTVKTQEDMDRLCAEFEKKCRSTSCKDCSAPGGKKALNQCYHAYLCELVEV